MIPDAPNFANALERAIRGVLRDLHVALPGRVETYDPSTQLADVKPMIPKMIPRVLGGFVEERMPVIPAVPVVFPRCGKFAISFPVAKGDGVLLVFCDYDPQEWRRTGEEVSPGVPARAHVTNAVAIPGIEPKAGALVSASATDMVIGQDGAGKPKIVIEPDGNVRAGTQSGSEDFVALAQLVLDRLQAIVDAFNAHVHTSGVGPTGVPTSLLSDPDPVAAANVKAD